MVYVCGGGGRLEPVSLEETAQASETNAAIANFLYTAEFFGLGLDYDMRLPDLLNAVTMDDVNAAARRVLDPNRAAVVIAGPYQ